MQIRGREKRRWKKENEREGKHWCADEHREGSLEFNEPVDRMFEQGGHRGR